MPQQQHQQHQRILHTEDLPSHSNINEMMSLLATPSAPSPSISSHSNRVTTRTSRPSTLSNIRYPPRIPRLIRRPHQSFTEDTSIHTSSIVSNTSTSSISSAINISRDDLEQRQHNMTPNSYFRADEVEYDEDLYCSLDEKAVDFSVVCEMEIQKKPSSTGYTPLDFKIIFEDGGNYSSTYSVENILKNDETVYCSRKCGTINILLQYKGTKCCTLSHIIIKSPQYGYTAPCKEGMIFISHKPIKIENTTSFDCFTREDYDKYMQKNKDGLDNTNPVAWFTASDQRLAVVNTDERFGKYVLIKLLRAEHASENMDLQYIGFVGHIGSRGFPKGVLC